MSSEQRIPKPSEATQPYLYGIEDLFLESEQLKYQNELEKQFPGLREYFKNLILYLSYTYKSINYREFPIAAGVLWQKPIGENSVTGIPLRSYSRYEISCTNGREDSTFHAEMSAMRNSMGLGGKYLENSVLISTVQPCTMCASGYSKAGGKAIIYAVSQDDLRGTSVFVKGKYEQFITEPRGYNIKDFLKDSNPRLIVACGYMKEEILAIMNPKIVSKTSR